MQVVQDLAEVGGKSTPSEDEIRNEISTSSCLTKMVINICVELCVSLSGLIAWWTPNKSCIQIWVADQTNFKLVPSFCVDQFCGTPKLAKYGLARFPVCRKGTRFRIKIPDLNPCAHVMCSLLDTCIYVYMRTCMYMYDVLSAPFFWRPIDLVI